MSKLLVSNSMLRTLTTCSTKAWLHTNGYSGSSAEENVAARAGSDAHKAFEKWHRGAHTDDCVQTFLDSYKPFSEKFLVTHDVKKPFQDRYHHDNLSRILDVFISVNPISTLPYEIVETEKQVELSLGTFDGVEFVVTDKSDGLVRMKDTGDYFALEDKTVSYIGENYIADYEMDSQITTHVEAWRRNGIDCKGVVLEAVQFSKIPDPNAVLQVRKKGVLTGETKPVTCRTHSGQLVRDCWTDHVKYGRWVITRDEEGIDEWMEAVRTKMYDYKYLLNHALEDADQEGIFGRCGSCEFRQFCKGHRRNLEGLNKRVREEGILYSGLYQ